jgi:hypothetical protein
VADHASHDPERVAAAADRGGRLAGVLAACGDCLVLLGDLRALASATPVAAIPRRPRDYRLTLADAERLRRRGWRRMLAAIGARRSAIGRPLALGLTTLGLVGLLLGSVPATLPFTAGASRDHIEVAQPAGVTGTGDAPAITTTTGQPAGDVLPSAGGAQDAAVTAMPGTDGSALRILSLTFLAGGLGTFAVRRVASSRRGMR